MRMKIKKCVLKYFFIVTTAPTKMYLGEFLTKLIFDEKLKLNIDLHKIEISQILSPL